MKELLDRRQLQKWAEESKRLLPLKTPPTELEPLIPSKNGFVLTKDDRLAFQFMLKSEAAKHGMDGLTPEEAYALMGRLENLPAIQDAALLLQRDVVVLYRAAKAVMTRLQRNEEPTKKERQDLSRILWELEDE